MFHRHLLVGCAVLLSVAAAGVASAAPYYFTALAPVGTYTTAIPYAFNSVNGQLEAVGKSGGGYYVTRGGYPVTWSNLGPGATVAGTNILANITGASAGDRITGIDGAGDLSGYSRNASNSQFPWYLPSGGTATALPVLSGSDAQTCTYAMNNSGQIVGAEGAEANPGTPGVAGTCQATLWAQSGGSWGVSVLPAVTSGMYAGAAAISNNGIVAGWSTNVVGGLNYQDAVTWTNTGSSWVANDLVNRNVYSLGAFARWASTAPAPPSAGEISAGSIPAAATMPWSLPAVGYPSCWGTSAQGAANGVAPDDTAYGINEQRRSSSALPPPAVAATTPSSTTPAPAARCRT